MEMELESINIETTLILADDIQEERRDVIVQEMCTAGRDEDQSASQAETTGQGRECHVRNRC